MPVTVKDIKDRIKRAYKRGDYTETDLTEWIGDATRRIVRGLQTPFNEAIRSVTVGPDFNGTINIPSNLLSLFTIDVNGVELEMRSQTEVNRLRKQSGQARAFVRVGAQYIIGPKPEEGSVIRLYYRGDVNNIKDDNDTLSLFDLAPDLVMYGALIRAADFGFDPPGIEKYTGFYNTAFAELQNLADRDAITNATMAFAYDSNGGSY